jgi:hypothetical protein
VPNEANWPMAGVLGTSLAKRTQFAPPWKRPTPDGRKMQNEPNFTHAPGDTGWCHSGPVGDLGPIVQNEANFPARQGGTEPRRRGPGRCTNEANSAAQPIAPNKPNLPSSEMKGKYLGGKDLWSIAPAKGLGKTKPIPGSAGRDGAWGTRDEGKSCKTNPICPAGLGGPPSPLAPPASPQPSQSCKTNPIPGGAGCDGARGGGVLYERNSREDSLHRVHRMAQIIVRVSARVGVRPGRTDVRTELSVSA